MELKRYDQIYKNEASYWWFKGRRKLLIDIFSKLPKKNSLKILDIGCCTGYNLHTLEKFGEVYGADIEKKAVEYCKKRGFKKISLLKNGLKLPFKKDFFDIVTCLDVIEHVEKDKKYLEELHRIIKPGGTLILFVPAFNLLWSQLDVRSHHIRRYTKSSLGKIAKAAKFIISDVKYFNYLLFLPVLPIRLFQKIPFFKNNGLGADLVVRSKLINNILNLIFLIDVWSIKWLSPPVGISVLLIAKKGKR
ncbi:hypothetical protein A3D83_01220 [Candidatus Daviesbacteria bacterium RIFCSPHIGHO2_02_FULL_41_10]|uniref:Methyltransferase type 11 domain-containing protein n=1 Tax=Candidatus Daviesbacteria bacterium RIFCSPHIGHO2_02_FULL_41_10 TaxID=1797774 RepID=A0A1F5JY73_9BACT|nr:MAG: hypothetical protein A3D83_01220 [Candidatus Daviesbacteria bacterium RIFCSPHIGHO2_02_FULL_41_10]